MMVSISQKDAHEFIRSLPKESVDLAISSPPYFLGKEFDTSRRLEDFVVMHERLMYDLIDRIKPGGSLCWQVGWHVRSKVVTPLDALIYTIFSRSPELRLRNRIIWTFGQGLVCKKRFSGRHETVLWFTKGDDYHFDLDAVRVPQEHPDKRSNPLGKNPADVWYIPNVSSRHAEKTVHPCQFPVALVRRLVRALCPEGGLVIDPYLGSGSTAVAAAMEGRRFAGCDLNAAYIAVARERLRKLRRGTLRVKPDHVSSKFRATA